MSGAPPSSRRGDPFRIVGTVLDRKYRVDEVVAEGGYGVVYAGHHLSLDVKVAIKALKPSRALDPGIAKIREPDMAIATPSGDTATQSRVSAFTPASAAPEQLAGARTGPWTDVFSLGLLLAELLTDRAPLPAGDVTEHLRVL